MLKLHLKLKFSVLAVFAFIVFTIVGTLSHEYGHIVIAKYLGYNTILHYGSMEYYKGDVHYKDDEDYKEVVKIYETFSNAIDNNLEFDEKERFLELQNILNIKYPEIDSKDDTNNLYVTLGGPIQTILTSFLGLFILWNRKSKTKGKFKISDWLGVFLSLFILREVFNFVTALFKTIFKSESNFHGDEFRISRFLGFDEWVVPSITVVLGMVISFYVIFKVIPLKYRFSFILAGLVGGILGFAIWFGFLGKLILP